MSTLETAGIEELQLRAAALKATPTGFAIARPDGTLHYINEALVHILGYDREELIGRTVGELWPDCPVPALDKLAQHGSWRGEWRTPRKDGQLIALDLSASLLSAEESAPRALIISVTDVTERYHVEADLRLKDAAIANSINGIAISDLSGAVIYVNDAFCKLFGATREQILGHSPFEFWPQQTERLVESLHQQGFYRAEDTALSLDGRWVAVHLAASMVRDAAGEPTAIVVVFADITERKQAEHALAQRTRDLERSNRELEQFAYVASHDLQEPLRMVSSYTQLLATRYTDKLDKDANEFIEYAVSGANRMQRLINDLLSYSRVNVRGKPAEPVDSHAALGQAISNLSLAIEESGAMVTHDDLPVVLADDLQLVQVFQNLIGNAIKFRREEPPRVHVSASRTQQGWTFAVRDNGAGIAPEYHTRIFQIFQRLHSKHYPGTGIGLALCKRIVERHGGEIWVESVPNQGSTFYFTLPS